MGPSPAVRPVKAQVALTEVTRRAPVEPAHIAPTTAVMVASVLSASEALDLTGLRSKALRRRFGFRFAIAKLASTIMIISIMLRRGEYALPLIESNHCGMDAVLSGQLKRTGIRGGIFSLRDRRSRNGASNGGPRYLWERICAYGEGMRALGVNARLRVLALHTGTHPHAHPHRWGRGRGDPESPRRDSDVPAWTPKIGLAEPLCDFGGRHTPSPNAALRTAFRRP